VASNGNSIGSGEPGAGNVVGNAFRGIRVSSSAAVDILGNLVGTEGTGQDIGNTIGIHLDDANANRIGGDAPSESNTVAFSSDRGIWIRGSQNAVEGNFVGTDAVGRVMGNEREGIEVEGSNNRIGVEGASGTGNTIAYSGSAGILVTGGTGMVLVENSIFENGGLGIDLAPVGATPNDPGDADAGPNGLQNFPEVVAAGYDDSTGEVVVDYTLDTPSGATPFQIDFYLADVDAEEGETWIGRDAYAAGGVPQQARFAPPSGVAVDSSSVVVLTATGPGFLSGPQTSEFGPPVPLPEPGGAQGLGAGVLLLALLRHARVRAG